MNKIKKRTFPALVIFLMVVTIWPVAGKAVDWFGNSSQEKIKYYQGYNDAIAAVTSYELPLPTKTTSVSSTDVSKLQKQIDTLNVKLSDLQAQQEAINIDDWGFDTLNYVTNPLSDNLDVTNFRIGSYTGDRQIVLDSNVNLNEWNLSNGFIYLNDDTLGKTLFYGNASGDGALAADFITSGDRAYALRSKASGANSYAAYLDGQTKITNGDLIVDRIKSSIEAVYFDSDVNLGVNTLFGRSLNFTSMEPGQLLLKASALGASSTAGFFEASGENSYAARFYGPVDINNGQLFLNHASLKVDSASNVSPAVSARTMVDGGTALNAIATNPNSTAAYFVGKSIFNGETEITGANLEFSNNLNPRIDVNTGVYSTLAINFDSVSSANQWGYDNLGEFFFTSDKRLGIGTSQPVDNIHVVNNNGQANMRLEGQGTRLGFINRSLENENSWAFATYGDKFYGDVVGDDLSGGAYHWLEVSRENYRPDVISFPEGKVGIGTNSPNKQLHVYAASGNAEIDIQSGDNTHWGIYQDSRSGSLNFWNGENRLTLSHRGLSTNGLCLNGQCITSWKDLDKILNPNIDEDPRLYPSEELVN